VTKKPVIGSFSYQVEPHIPLRPRKATVTQTTAKAKAKAAEAAAVSAMGGNRGGGGNQRNPNEPPPKPASTTIISILPEGNPVSTGDVVCELDASAFKDELQAQKIRYLQAKAWVEQATAILAVSEISLEEYRDGILPQDRQLIRQYISTCEIEKERAERNLEWSKKVVAKHYRAAAQLTADTLAVQQADIALREARGMLERLDKYTGPRLVTELNAKIMAVKADKLAQEAAFQLEVDRLKKLETMVENCTLRAPRDGIVGYFHPPFSFRRRADEDQIIEGASVREGQPIFILPDPTRMQVKTRVNESKIALIRRGQRAEIRIEAYPDHVLKGEVAEITALPETVNWRSADVRAYAVTVKIDTGAFKDLLPGLSAEVDIHIDTQRQVPRVPLESLRWVNGEAYAALVRTSPQGHWQWKSVTVGLSDEQYAQVLSGLEPGDRVVADAESLPGPSHQLTADEGKTAPATTVASAGVAR
jgi:multidrug resistance efflux pump